jgi:hypothetical protein
MNKSYLTTRSFIFYLLSFIFYLLSFIFYLLSLIIIFAISKGNGVLPYPTALQKLMTPD